MATKAYKTTFTGFDKKTVAFFKKLENNNSKKWFDDHREEYDQYVVKLARDFVVDMGARLKKVVPGLIADPRVNQSLFRINRDVRFSKDKRPYKTNLAIWFWEGQKKRMECSGFYFHLEPGKLMFGAGIYMFDKPYLQQYRDSVVDPKQGPKLARAIKKIEGQIKGGGSCGLYQGQRYKRIPQGYDADHKYADLLLNKGLTAFDEGPIPKEFYSRDLLDYAMLRYKKMVPLHRWLVEMVERV